ncbi:hypothetical protein IE53DRAFT_336374 [Violaceomyces palustris]|uniref:Uncharacterized protein n=1 Tax=Violaceomyces palustris TaxID=1673888 RepID=A0ACD0NM31_9BASI|nr:hypothetical protein IE53DRAFT_336374 [Violaceomyces palustris]
MQFLRVISFTALAAAMAVSESFAASSPVGALGNPTALTTTVMSLIHLKREETSSSPSIQKRTYPSTTTNIDQSGQCSVSGVSCCQQIVSDDSTKKQLAGLAGINEILGNVGLICDQVPVIAGAVQNTCKTTPQCCQNVQQNGLVNFGCINAPLA